MRLPTPPPSSYDGGDDVIIKGERVTSSRSATPLLRHLLHGEKNDRVTLVQGTEEDVRAAFADARDASKKFALRHFIISPASKTTRAEAMMILGLLARDFAFDPATAIVFEHNSPRAVATAFGTHWHCLVPEIDAATGRVMDSRYNFLRHEKIAILAAHRLGRTHEFVRSPHEEAGARGIGIRRLPRCRGGTTRFHRERPGRCTP
jgi:hypothetical protein